MGQSALEMISAITPLMLGLAGICACIALAMALGRYFMYEHGNDDLQPASKRITHVFGFIAAIGFVSVGGMNLAKKWATDSTINPAIGGSGSSMVPEGAAKGNNYSNIGDLIMGQAKDHKLTDEQADDIAETVTEFEKQYHEEYGEGGNAEFEAFKAEFKEKYGEELYNQFVSAYGENNYNKLKEAIEKKRAEG